MHAYSGDNRHWKPFHQDLIWENTQCIILSKENANMNIIFKHVKYVNVYAEKKW